MRNIKSIIIGLLLAFAILFTLAVTVSLIYEEEVSRYLVEELNDYILTEINVEEIDLSIIKKFPNATLQFKDVTIYSKSGYLKEIKGYNTDTLIYAKSIFIQIDLLSLLSKNYEIKSRKATAWTAPKLFGVSQKQIQLSDYIVYIEFNNNWDVVKLLKIPTDKLNPNKYNRIHLNKFLNEYSILDLF